MIDNSVLELLLLTQNYIGEPLDSSYQGVKGLFVFAYNNTVGDDQIFVDSFKKYFLPKVKIETTTLKLTEDISMISQLMTQLNNTMK